MSLRKIFLHEIEQELLLPQQNSHTLGPEQTATFPLLLQTYLHKCGFVGKPIARNLFILWGDTYLKLKPESNWMRISCRQFNAAAQPTRIALIQSKIMGFIPFAGRDKYQNSEGNMLIKLGTFTVSNTKGPEMNVSALVTFLSEAVLLPAALHKQYNKWRQLDTHTLEATITDAGINATGRFYFDETGLPYKFETEDRFYSTGGKRCQKYPWAAYYLDYKELNGLYLPSKLKAAWQLPAGEYIYFEGNIASIMYGVEAISEIKV